jgi:5-hydroxyisourate hydrolase
MTKPGGISIHVFDVSRGISATGLRVELRAPDGKLLVSGAINAAGVLDHPTVRGEGLTATGIYEAVFHVGDWYRVQGVAVPSPAFLEVVPVRSKNRNGRETNELGGLDSCV